MPTAFWQSAMTGLALSLSIAACNDSGTGTTASNPTAAGNKDWFGAWSAAPYGPFPLGPLGGTLPIDPLGAITRFDGEQARDQSFRMVVHPTVGGDRLRLRLSDLMGDRPLRFEPVSVGLRLAGPALVPGSLRAVQFGGEPGVTIAPGTEAISDPVDLTYSKGQDLAVSFHLAGSSGPMTWHAVSFGPNYVSQPGSGDVSADPSGASLAQISLGWFFLSGIDVQGADYVGSMVMLGDSITDGAYEVPESNTRWPDLVAQRLDAAGIRMGVLNQGINSNTVTRAGILDGEQYKGPAAEDRFRRDVLERSGVRAVLIFEGTNDLTAGVRAPTLIAGLQGLIDRAHQAGLCVVVGTLMPRDDLLFGWDRATMESERQAVNTYLRAATVEGLADFDAVMGSPIDPTRPNPAYYSPDLLHPTSLGFMVMANAVPLQPLVPAPLGTCMRRR